MKKNQLFKFIVTILVIVSSISIILAYSKNVNKKNALKSNVKDSKNNISWKEDTTPITFDWYINFSWFANQWGIDDTSKYITKKTGVNINFIVPSGNENEKLITMIASGKLPDFITAGWWEEPINRMIESKQVLPLNQLAEKYDPYFYEVADKVKLNWYRQEDGNIYGYPNASTSPNELDKNKDDRVSNQTFLVRKDIYKAIGSPDMRTREGFLNALMKAKEKFPTVNGKPLIPFGCYEFTNQGNYSFESYLANFLAIPREKEGNLYDKLYDKDYINWLKTFRKANEMGLMNQEIFIDTRPQIEEKIAEGRYFSMLYQRSDMFAQQQILHIKDANSVYIAVDGPSNSKLDNPTLAGDEIVGWTLSLISKTCKDPARAIRFMSYLISEEGEKDLYLGQKGVSYDNINGIDQFKPEVLQLMNKDNATFQKKYGAAYTFWMLMDNKLSVKYAPKTVEPFKQLEDWTKGKTVDFNKYNDIDPKGDSEEAISQDNIVELWSKTLPRLLIADADKSFDIILHNYLSKRKDLGYDEVVKYQEKKIKINESKLDKY